MARGEAPIQKLDDLRAPIADVLALFRHQAALLDHYRSKYGDVEEIEDGSDTEQE